MMSRSQRRRRSAVAVILAMSALIALSSLALAAPAAHQAVAINFHPQAQGAYGLSGAVGADAVATLTRRDDGVSWRFQTSRLQPGHAYTIWFVVLNDPDQCLGVPTCNAPDIVTRHLITDSQVTYGAGHVVGGSGQATFAASFQAGAIGGWFEGGGLWDPRTADIHLVLNDHGPMLPAYMPGMTHTYRAGCTDASLPMLFHQGAPAAIADGAPGPNTCVLYQTAVFEAP